MNSINSAEDRGKEEGIEIGEDRGITKGIEIGEERKNIEFAKIMKADGDSIEKIQRYTGLSKEEIEELSTHKLPILAPK